MTRPLSAVARVAATPDQAKVFVALLQAEGIPAYVEGDMLADEVATSRRLMNLGGTRVLVPRASLERAREILGKVEVDPAELEQQALAAADPEHMPEPPPPASPSAARPPLWALVVATVAAGVFLCLWLWELAVRAGERDPRFLYEPVEFGLRELRRSDGVLLRTYVDLDGNGIYDRNTKFRADLSVAFHLVDEDEDGVWEVCKDHREDGTTTTWSDKDGDGIYDEATVTDREGRVLQTLVWQPGTGFVPKKP